MGAKCLGVGNAVKATVDKSTMWSPSSHYICKKMNYIISIIMWVILQIDVQLVISHSFGSHVRNAVSFCTGTFLCVHCFPGFSVDPYWDNWVLQQIEYFFVTFLKKLLLRRVKLCNKMIKFSSCPKVLVFIFHFLKFKVLLVNCFNTLL